MLENILWIAITVSSIGIVVYLVSRNKQRVIQVMSGWGIYQFLSAIYDYPFWAFIQYKFGVYGSIGLSIGALVINLILLHWYVKRGVDWLGVKILEEIKDNAEKWVKKMTHNRSILFRIVTFIPVKLFSIITTALNSNDLLAFFFLSIWQDPFITTSFLRHANRSRQVKKKDYTILILSTIVTSIFWSFVIGIIINIITLLN